MSRFNLVEILRNAISRRRLMVNSIIAIQAREGIETTVEQAERAYDKVQAEQSTRIVKG